MDLKNQTVLVTGAGGFIGSHLCEELVAADARVRAMVRYNSSGSHGLLESLPRDIYKELNVVFCDVRDAALVKRAIQGCKIVFHLAALVGIPFSYDSPESYLETNIRGTFNVLQACLEGEVERLVHTSTSEVYGTALYTPIDEAHPLQGQSPYSASKIGADKMAESYYRSFNLPVVTIRPFNCFGPRQSARAFIPGMIAQILCEEKVCCGSLSPRRDYTFVKETAAGFMACASVDGIEGSTINVGSGREIAMGDLLNLIMDRMNISKEIVQERRRVRPDRSEVFELICDNTKARDLLDWYPKRSLGESLDDTIEYVKKHITSYRTADYVV